MRRIHKQVFRRLSLGLNPTPKTVLRRRHRKPYCILLGKISKCDDSCSTQQAMPFCTSSRLNIRAIVMRNPIAQRFKGPTPALPLPIGRLAAENRDRADHGFRRRHSKTAAQGMIQSSHQSRSRLHHSRMRRSAVPRQGSAAPRRCRQSARWDTRLDAAFRPVVD